MFALNLTVCWIQRVFENAVFEMSIFCKWFLFLFSIYAIKTLMFFYQYAQTAWIVLTQLRSFCYWLLFNFLFDLTFKPFWIGYYRWILCLRNLVWKIRLCVSLKKLHMCTLTHFDQLTCTIYLNDPYLVKIWNSIRFSLK